MQMNIGVRERKACMRNQVQFLFRLLVTFLVASPSFAESLSISCGESQGYAYYFEGGVVDKASSGFSKDAISGGKITLNVNEKGEGDILTIDATGAIKSAKSQGAQVIVLPTSGTGVNWMAMYSDGTLEVYSYNGNTNKVASYRNTVGNPVVAKNSLFISDCQ